MNTDQMIENAKVRNKLEIEQINRHFPEIIIEEKNDDNDIKFHYYFRCLTSEDDTDGFDSPVEALAHFAKRLSDESDSLLNDDDTGINDEVNADCYEANAKYREA